MENFEMDGITKVNGKIFSLSSDVWFDSEDLHLARINVVITMSKTGKTPLGLNRVMEQLHYRGEI